MRVFSCIMVVVLLVACSDDDILVQKVQGRLVSEVTGNSVEGASVIVQSKETRGTGIFSSVQLLDERKVVTNQDGLFETSLQINSRNNAYSFYIADNTVCTGVIGPKNNFFHNEVDNSIPITLQVRVFHPIEIAVKSTTSSSDTDQIYVTFFHKGTTWNDNPVYAIENRGIENVQNDTGSPEFDGLEPFWIGEGVDATIFKRIQEGIETQVRWSVIKNGVQTEHTSDFIPTNVNGVTRFEINY